MIDTTLMIRGKLDQRPEEERHQPNQKLICTFIDVVPGAGFE